MALTKKTPQSLGLDDDEEGFGAWYAEHATAVNWLLAILLIGLLAWRGYGWWQQSNLESASSVYSPLQKDYTTAMAEADVEKKRASLQALVSRGETVGADHAGKPVGIEAQLLAANAQYYVGLTQTGKEAEESLTKARAAFEKIVAAAGDDRAKAAGQLGLGNTLENLFFITQNPQTGVEATDAYKRVEQLAPGTYLAAESKLAQARVLQAQKGRQEEAKQLYASLAADRKLPEIEKNAEDTTVTTQQGQVITPEDMDSIRSFREFSYQAVAEKSQKQLQGLPTAAQ